MKTNAFPEKYNEMCDREYKREIGEEKKHHDSRISELQNRTSDQSQGKTSDFGIKRKGLVVGLGVGFLGYAGTCLILKKIIGDDAFFVGEVVYAVIVLICVLAGKRIDKLAMERKKEEEEWIKSQISLENKHFDETLFNIRSKYNEQKKNYKECFETRSKELSLKYADSSLAKEVVEWMTKAFSSAVEAADRREHIARITVPFTFSVYEKKITCDVGTFDFELKRCAFLNSALEQDAVARVIDTELQLKIAAKYKRDTTGTPVDLQLSQQYFNDHISITLTYEAQNGNYKLIRDWNES